MDNPRSFVPLITIIYSALSTLFNNVGTFYTTMLFNIVLKCTKSFEIILLATGCYKRMKKNLKNHPNRKSHHKLNDVKVLGICVKYSNYINYIIIQVSESLNLID